MARWDPPYVIQRITQCLQAKVSGMYLHSFFGVKIPFFKTERCFNVYTCLRRFSGNTDSKYIWVCGCNFKCSSVNRGYTDKWIDKETERLFLLYSINIDDRDGSMISEGVVLLFMNKNHTHYFQKHAL